MLLHMRTTVRLDDALARAAKMRAAEQGITLTRLIDESLRERLMHTPGREGGARPLDVPTYGEGGLRAGVDLSDNRALGDLMDDGSRAGGGPAGERAA
jgi:hypothetical protein